MIKHIRFYIFALLMFAVTGMDNLAFAQNNPPVITVDDIPRTVVEGQEYTMSGITVTDADSGDNGSVSYEWRIEINRGLHLYSGDLDSRRIHLPSFTTPGVLTDTDVVWRLRVTDGGTPPRSTDALVTVTITNDPNNPNNANHASIITIADIPRTVVEGQRYTMSGITVTDIDSGANGRLSYRWSVSNPGGTSLNSSHLDNREILLPSFTPPGVLADTDVVLRLRVSDGSTPQRRTSALVTVTITHDPNANANHAPIITIADIPRTVVEGQRYRMSGITVTDADSGANGRVSEYDWNVVNSGGTGLRYQDLNNDKIFLPSFTAPGVVADTDVVLRLRVTDGGTPRREMTARVTVTITHDPNANINRHAPIITFADIPRTVAEGQRYTMAGITVTDADSGANGRVTAYEWFIEYAGSTYLSENHLDDKFILLPSFTAPGVLSDTDVTFVLGVWDGGTPRRVSSERVEVTITNTNAAPVIIVTNRTRTVAEGQVHTVSGVAVSGTNRMENGDLTYTWAISSGGGSLSNTNGLTPEYTAPQVNANTNAVLRLTVMDSRSPPLSDAEDITVTITNNTAPVITVADIPRTVVEGQVHTVSGVTVSDSDSGANGNLTYTWAVSSGGGSLSNTNGLTPEYTAPQVNADTNAVLSLTVMDGGSPRLSDAENVTVTITNNTAPTNTEPVITVDSRPRTVAEGQVHAVLGVTVRDTDSGANGSLTYTWAVVSGGGILSNPNGLTPRYIAPQVNANTNAVLRLTVMDGGLPRLSDTENVTITNTATPPVISGHTSTRTVNEGARFTMSGISVADAQGSVTYAWTVVNNGGTSLATGNLTNHTRLTPSFTAPIVTANRNVTLRLTATDGDGLTDAENVTVQIVNVNAPPPQHAVIIPEVTRSIAANLADTISGRVTALRDGRIAKLAGHSTAAGFLSAYDNNRNAKSLLSDTAFNLPFNANDALGGSRNLAFWGGLDYRAVDGESDDIKWDGTLTGLQLGIDGVLSNGKIAGVAISRTSGGLEYGEAATAYDVSLLGVHPYLAWKNGKRNWWASAGISSGEVEDGGTTDDLSIQTVGVGADGWQANVRGVAAALSGEFTHSSADVGGVGVSGTRLRASADFARASGATRYGANTALRGDFGDGDTGFGAEIGYGVNHQPNSRTVFTANARTLLFHTGEYGELTLQANFRRKAGADGQGVSFNLAPSYRDTADFNAGIAYGITTMRGMVTPFADVGSVRHQFGINWKPHRQIKLGFVGDRTVGDSKAEVKVDINF